MATGHRRNEDSRNRIGDQNIVDCKSTLKITTSTLKKFVYLSSGQTSSGKFQKLVLAVIFPSRGSGKKKSGKEKRKASLV